MPQRPFEGSPAETIKIGIRFALSILSGFLRHGWGALNDGNMREVGKMQTVPHLSRRHHSNAPTSGYSLAGCSPAEPACASPDTLSSTLVWVATHVERALPSTAQH
jgi:hypothetical protein